MRKEYNENEARNKAEAYCSSVERCVSDVTSKLEQWGVAPEVIERVIGHLLKEKYIDPKRYCSAFVRDKYRFNQWGRVKIAQTLRMKGLPAGDIDNGMQEIDEHEYMEILSRLIAQKRKSVKAKTEYERNGKLIRFAIGRGFEMEAILRCVKQVDGDEAGMG